MLGWACAALLVLLIGPGPSSAAPALPRPMTAAEVASWLRALASVRSELQKAAGVTAQPTGDHVAVTIFGGLPPPIEETFTVTPALDGRWTVERLNHQAGHPAPERLSYDLPPGSSQLISELAARKQLYQEPRGQIGTCTDSPIVVVEVVFRGSRRQAVRTACPKPDLTGQLIEAVISAPPDGGR